MKERQVIQVRDGRWCPAKIVPVRSSKRLRHATHSYFCRAGWDSSCPYFVSWGEAL